jgi:hypothetical protein
MTASTDVITSMEFTKNVGKVKNGEYLEMTTSEDDIINQFHVRCAYSQDIQAKMRAVNA